MKLSDGKGTALCIQRAIFSVLILFLLSSFGCATVQAPPSAYQPQNAVGGTQNAERSLTLSAERRTQNAGSVAALVSLLEKKNVLSADEAARFKENAERSLTPNADVAALAALLEKKNVLSADEAARFRGNAERGTQYAERGTQNAERGTPNAYDKEQIEKITANVTEELRKNIQEQVKSEVSQELPVEMAKVEQAAAAPAWTQRIRFGGDIRLRYENDRIDKNNDNGFGNPSDLTQIMNTTHNQDLYKYRVRVGAALDVNDQLETVVRLSTGNTTNPVSTNSILGTYFNKDNVLFDLAYVRWKPSESFNIYGGRIPNLFFSTDLVWSRDLNFEGLALTARKPITESWRSFLTAGVFPLQQAAADNFFSSPHEKWLFGGQLGLENPDQKGISYKLGASYYDFYNITGVLNTNPDTPGATNWSAPLFQQKGNSIFPIDPANSQKVGLASEFREINITGTLDVGLWDPYHVVFLGDYVNNVGYNRNKVAQLSGNLNVDNMGYQIGISVGHPVIEKFGQWNAYLNYKYLEGDAVVDAFTDPDFHLGGANAKGWILGTDFGVMKNSWFRLRWMTANQISGPPLAIDVLQLDFNAKF
jgi:hypothetical protein